MKTVTDCRDGRGERGGAGGRGLLRRLLIQPGLGTGGVGDELLSLEPQVNLSLGVLQGVAAVDDVPERTEGNISDVRTQPEQNHGMEVMDKTC